MRGQLRRRLDWYNELYAAETDEDRREAYRYQIAQLEERLTELDRATAATSKTVVLSGI